MTLVPMISLGQQLGVPTPAMTAVAELACALMGEDFWATGRTVESLGLAGLTVRQIRRLVMEGEPGAP